MSRNTSTTKKQQAKDYHQKWLEDRGLSSSQLAIKAKNYPSINRFTDLKTESKIPLSNGFAPVRGKSTMMEKRFKETASVRAEIERKANSLASPYNKGAAQYVSTKEDAKYIGRK